VITRLSFLVALMMSVVGCQSGSDPDRTAPPGDDSDVSVQPSQRGGTPVVTHEARLGIDPAVAFTAKGQAWHAAQPTHDVTVDRGVVRMVPIDRGVRGTALVLETADIARGDLALGGYGGDAVDGAGRVIVDRGTVVEELENFESGIEQSWTFSQPPAGTGDLVVNVVVTGHELIADNDSGLHFATPGGIGFRYSHAMWIDANGDVTPIRAAWDGGHVVMLVPEDVLVESAYPAVLDPTVNPEIAVDNPLIGTTGTGAVRSAIATSGAGFLAAWSDGRNGTNDIFGTRLSATGAVLDSLGISIQESAAVEDNATATFANGEYVVAFDDGTTVGAARITTAGAVTPLTVGAGHTPKIAGGGTGALVVFENGGNISGSIYNGTSFGAPFAIGGGGTSILPAVAANPGGDYLVVWTEGATAPDLRGQFVSPAGTLSGAAFTISAGADGQRDADAAFNGTDFVVVWTNAVAADDVYGTRVTTAGVVLDTHLEGTVTVGGKPIAAATNLQNQPAVACGTGGTCLATWTDRRTFATTLNDVYAVRLDGSLNPIGAEILVAALTDEQRSPAVVAVGGDWRLTWHDKRAGNADTVFSARVLADGSLPDGSGQNIVFGYNREQSPTVRASTNNWLVAWSDSRVLGNDIMGVRFGGSGSKLDGAARVITNATGQQGSPALTFDGTNYLAVWNDTRNGPSQDIWAGRMDVTGNQLDGTGFQVASANGDQRRPAVATGGGVSLAVWQDGRSGNEIYGAVITGGAVTVTDIPICTGAGSQVDPAVAFDSVNSVFVVTWNDNRSGDDDVYAARVDTSGALVDAVCGVAIASGGGNQTQSKITSSGGQLYVTYTDSSADVNGDIRGERITAAGSISVLDPGGDAIATGAAAQTTSDVVFVSPNLYVVVWADNRDAGTSGFDIYGQTVLITNGALDGANFVISANPEDETTPSVTSGPGGRPAMVAYERQRPDLNTMRVGTRRIVFSGSTGTTCAMDSACVSGFCVDGRCCDQACGGTDKTDCQACSVAAGAQVNGECSVILSTTHVCRGYATVFCDIKEFCDGVSTSCPPDLGRREGIACTDAAGNPGVCPANDITGAPHFCQ
jgi:large repetitive protein